MALNYYIKENSRLARISAFKLRKSRCAMVINRTIYLWGITSEDFLADKAYLNHELQHIYQYHELGVLRFIFFYLLESIRRGYYNNKFEIEARAAENLPGKTEYVLIK